MPKMSAAAAKRVDQAEARHETGGSFEPLAPGDYLAQLREVTVRDKPNKYGAAVWSAEFHNLHNLETGETAPGRQWYDLTQPSPLDKVPALYLESVAGATPDRWEKYQGMLDGLLKGFFESFGYTVDSDTDEMLGEWVVITLGHETVQQGVNQGKIRNRVTGIKAVPEDVDLSQYGVAAVAEDDAF